MAFSRSENNTLRELAKPVAEIAELPIMAERRAMWTRHNRLERVRPMILLFPEGSWDELIPEKDLPRLWNLWRKQGRHVNSPVKDPVIPGLEEDPDNPFVDTQLDRAVNYLKDVQAHRKLTAPVDKTVVGN